MLGIEAGKNPIPVLRIGKIITFAQFCQIGPALDSKTTSLVTPIRHFQHEAVVLSAVMNQFPGREWHSIFPDHLMNIAGAAG